MMTVSLSNRGALGWLGAVLAGCLSAAAFAFALSHVGTTLVYFAYLAPIPLLISGLASGAISGAVASAVGTLVLLMLPTQNIAFVYAVINAVPSTFLIFLAMRSKQGADGKVYWYPEGYLATALAIYPCLLFAIALFLAADYGGLLAVSIQTLQDMINQNSAKIDPAIVASFSEMKEPIARMLPSMIGCGWIILMIFSGIVAQSSLKQQKWNIRTPFSLRNIHLPNWLLIAVAACGLAIFVAPAPYDYVGTNLCVMLCIPLFLVGLAIIHSFASTRKTKTPLLILFYVLLSLFPPVGILVALLGALDQTIDFRQRMTNFKKQP